MNRKVIVLLILFFLSLLFACGGYYLVHYSKQNEFEKSIFLSENSSINFEVCLKDNDFIEKKCLTKNDKENTYIASLIDYINLNYAYKVVFDKNFNGEYSYYFEAEVKADKSDSDINNYFSKEYVLSDKITKTFSNEENINILDSVKISYDEYNEILNRFKNTYGLNINGKLIVSLEMQILYTDEILGRTISKNISIPVTIPLTTQVVEIPIVSTDINNKEKIYSSDIVSKDKKYIICKSIGYTCFVISALFIISFSKYGIKYAIKFSEYKKQLKKILRMYDGIIVNVKKCPDFKGDITEVESFNELIDAHSEIRKPINFIEQGNGALFYLISDGNIWIYKLNKNEND